MNHGVLFRLRYEGNASIDGNKMNLQGFSSEVSQTVKQTLHDSIYMSYGK